MLRIKRNSDAREWMMMLGTLVVRLSAPNGLPRKYESQPKRPLWKHFDDTHHWDSDAEEWIPNDR